MPVYSLLRESRRAGHRGLRGWLAQREAHHTPLAGDDCRTDTAGGSEDCGNGSTARRGNVQPGEGGMPTVVFESRCRRWTRDCYGAPWGGRPSRAVYWSRASRISLSPQLLGPSSLARTDLGEHEVAGLRIRGLCDRYPFALVTSTSCGLLSDAVRMTSEVWSAEPLTAKTLGTVRERLPELQWLSFLG